MAKYIVTLTGRETIARNTIVLSFTKPDQFSFQPGQYVLLTLNITKNGEKITEARHLSIASTPPEPKLVFAVRLRDTDYKRTLRTLPLGSAAEIDGPSGKFTLPEVLEKPLVFLAGGIGITPVISMLRHLAKTAQTSPPIHLFYSNRQLPDAAYLSELHRFEKTIPGFSFYHTLTRDTAAAGLRGRISGDLIKRHAPDAANSHCYIVGPGPMVLAMENIMLELGLSKDAITASKFCGYSGYICDACRVKYGLTYQLQ